LSYGPIKLGEDARGKLAPHSAFIYLSSITTLPVDKQRRFRTVVIS